MAIECPHCRTRVYPDAAGICPACLKNTHDLSGVDTTKTTVVVRAKSKMPSVCCDCGFPTRRVVKVTSCGAHDVHGDGGSDRAWNLFQGFVAFGMLFVGWIAILGSSDPNQKNRVLHKTTIRVPQCDACARNEITPVSANHEKGTIKLLVDKRFAQSFRECNGPHPTSV